MRHLFTAQRAPDPDLAQQPLTRFKQMHHREAPAPGRSGDMDPYENLSRSRHDHVRAAPLPQVAAPAPAKRDLAADLHASDPVTVSVLYAALPLRTASVLTRQED